MKGVANEFRRRPAEEVVRVTGWRRRQAGAADERERDKALRLPDRQLHGQPAAQRAAHGVHTLQARLLQPIQIEIGQIVHAFQPIGVARFAEAGVFGCQHVPIRGEFLEKLRHLRDAIGAMQIKQGHAFAGAPQSHPALIHLGPTQRKHRFHLHAFLYLCRANRTV